MQYNDQIIVDDNIIILLCWPYKAILGWLLSQAKVFLAQFGPFVPNNYQTQFQNLNSLQQRKKDLKGQSWLGS